MLRFVVVFGLFASSIVGAEAQRKQPPNWTRIDKGLFLGGWVEMPPEGVTAVLNVSEYKDIYRPEHYLWRPIKDRQNGATIEFLREVVGFIDAQQKAGRPTFVHCNEGVSRAPMVMAAYLMSANGWTRDEALDYLRERRPVIRPNAAFMELLLRWERTLK